jgi:hypothetical protein
MSADGVLAPQATKFLETLAKRLTEMRLRLQFASVRVAKSLVLRTPKANYPRPISFAEGRSVMPPWLYRDF